MLQDFPYAVGLLVGLLSTTHCIGMCGNIMGAMSLGLPLEIRQRPARFSGYVLAYNLGRLATYGLLGLLTGTAGHWLGQGTDPAAWQLGSGLFATAILVLIGLYLTGWAPWVRQVDRLGSGLWRRVEPLGRRLLGVRSMPSALLSGMVWGLLPCGLVYYALMLTLALADPARGAAFMLAFGLGTMPGLVTAGVFAGRLGQLARRPVARRFAGLSLAGLAVVMFVLGQGLWTPPSTAAEAQSQGVMKSHVDG